MLKKMLFSLLIVFSIVSYGFSSCKWDANQDVTFYVYDNTTNDSIRFADIELVGCFETRYCNPFETMKFTTNIFGTYTVYGLCATEPHFVRAGKPFYQTSDSELFYPMYEPYKSIGLDPL